MISDIISNSTAFVCLKILAKMTQTSEALSSLENSDQFTPLLVVHVTLYRRIPFVPGSLNRAVKPKRQRKEVEFLVLSLVRLTILKKEGKRTIDFKLNGHVVSAPTASYYSSGICVLSKYRRGH